MNAPDAPFEEPWQAQIFALAVALSEAGHFTWAEWANAFGKNVRDAEPGAYWTIWSDTLVSILDSRGIAAAADVAAMAARWQEAARATPHGQPISL